jgi:hypothetical protein
MLSPVKAITAGALVFAIGSALLIAQPSGQQGSVPTAEGDAVDPTWITGHVQPAPSCSEPPPVADGAVLRSRDVECSPQTWTSSDPRLAGAVSRRWNVDTYQGSASVARDAAYLRNEGGSWACLGISLAKYAVDVADPLTLDCVGEGGYAGLSAILVLVDAGGYDEDIVGFVFSGDLPPVPEPPAVE